MALQMKRHCEKCNTGLDHASSAYICSFECTFCPPCAQKLGSVCPNCQGQLVARPTRGDDHATKTAGALASATTPFSGYIDG